MAIKGIFDRSSTGDLSLENAYANISNIQVDKTNAYFYVNIFATEDARVGNKPFICRVEKSLGIDPAEDMSIFKIIYRGLKGFAEFKDWEAA